MDDMGHRREFKTMNLQRLVYLISGPEEKLRVMLANPIIAFDFDVRGNSVRVCTDLALDQDPLAREREFVEAAKVADVTVQRLIEDGDNKYPVLFAGSDGLAWSKSGRIE